MPPKRARLSPGHKLLPNAFNDLKCPVRLNPDLFSCVNVPQDRDCSSVPVDLLCSGGGAGHEPTLPVLPPTVTMMSMGFSYPQPVVAPGAFHYGSGSGFPSTSPEEEAQAAWHMGQQDKIGHPSVESSFLPAPPGTVYFGGDVVKPEQSSGPPAFDKVSRDLASRVGVATG